MSVLAIQTSDPTCHVWVGDRAFEWEAGRTLAHGLLAYLHECLDAAGMTFADVDGLAVFRGPGSFTGLRIGITVMNTIAAAQEIPIVGETGDEWRERAAVRLAGGENDRIVLPEYGSEAHISPPKK